MGLIIGPRGCNHKRLETESGAQISVRGKGTQKEGKKTDHQNDEEASMPMHVHIAGDTEESVEKAVALIEPLLDPFHPMHEEFKKRGLEQLALVNGISFGQLDQQRCAVCGATGHLAYECPDTQISQNFKRPDVKCTLCGDMGHVTMDCKLARGNERFIPHLPGNSPGCITGRMPPPPPPPPHQIALDKLKFDQEYSRMMNELTGDNSLNEEINEGSIPTNASPVTIINGIPMTMVTLPPGVSPSIPVATESPSVPNPFAPQIPWPVRPGMAQLDRNRIIPANVLGIGAIPRLISPPPPPEGFTAGNPSPSNFPVMPIFPWQMMVPNNPMGSMMPGLPPVQANMANMPNYDPNQMAHLAAWQMSMMGGMWDPNMMMPINPFIGATDPSGQPNKPAATNSVENQASGNYDMDTSN